MLSLALIPIAFILGSLPFSVWLSNIYLRQDVRQFGDGNPGATNAYKAGGTLIGLIVLILDISKAAAPVGLAYFNLGIQGFPIFFIATAPLLGHVFSPFLRFKGGKGLATVLGVWIGLTIWKSSLAAVIGALIGIAVFAATGWGIMLAFVFILASLLIFIPNPIFLLVWFTQTLIQISGLRPWLMERLRIPN